MNLTAKKRAGQTKGAIKAARREGSIPAVFYSPGQPGLSVEIDGTGFEAALRKIKPNHLSTTVFTVEYEGKKIKALVKDIQYDVTSYRVLHLDFIELQDDVQVKVNVPIQFTGVAECVGIKLGGAIRQVIRNVKVKCLPKHIPDMFELDVRSLGMKQAKRLSDIQLPAGVETLAKTDEVVVVVAKR